MRLIVFTCSLIMLHNNIFAQDNTQKIPDFVDVFPVSPEAANLGSYGNVPINLSSGQLGFEVPLYTIKLRGIEIPLLLSYNYSGYKVSEKSGVFGMGWTFIGGGVINRQVNQKPDENSTGYIGGNYASIVKRYINNLLPIDSLKLLVQYSAEKKWDTQPDRFNVSAPGLNGSFCFNEKRATVFFPFKNYMVEIPSFQNPSVTTISDIIITDDKGVKYTFSFRERTRRENISITDGSETYTSAWFIKSIFNPKTNETVEFKYREFVYDPVYTYSQTLSVNSYVGSVLDDPAIDECFRNNFESGYSEFEIRNNSYLLDTIIFPGGKVIFQRNSVAGILKKEVVGMLVVNNNEVVTQYNFHFGNLESTGTNKKLSKIEKVGKNGDLEDYYNFNYKEDLPAYNINDLQFAQDFWGFFNSNSSTDLIASFDTRLPDFESGSVGALSEIIYPTKGKTEIIYEPNTIGVKSSMIDPFYKPFARFNKTFNGAASANNSINEQIVVDTLEIPFRISGLSAEFTYNLIANGNTASAEISVTPIVIYDQSANGLAEITDWDSGTEFPINKTISGEIKPGKYKVVLKAIKRLQLSNSLIIFSVKFFDDTKFEIGGIRVKQTKNYSDSKSTTPDLVKNYYYVDSENNSSGKLLSKGVFEFKSSYLIDCDFNPDNNTNTTLIERTNYYSSSLSPLEMYSGGPVYYKRVEESYNNGFDFGKTTSDFIEIGEVKINYPYSPWLINDWIRGKLVKQEMFKSENNNLIPIQKIEYSYNVHTPIDKLERPLNVYGFTSAEFVAGQTYFAFENFRWENYGYNSNDFLHTTTIETNYFSNDSIQIRKINEYNKDNLYLRANKQIENNVETSKSIIYYPDDFNNTLYNFSSLKNNNILNIPLRKEVYRNGKFVSGIITTYNNNGSQNEVYSFENELPQTPIDLDKNVLFNFPDYTKKGKYIYNSDATNLLGVQQENQPNRFIVWSYNIEYPVIKIESNNQSVPVDQIQTIVNGLTLSGGETKASVDADIALLKSAFSAYQGDEYLFAVYTYKPLVGVTSETDTRGRTTYYLYDGFGRLKEVRDHDYNIIKQYEYKYASQAQ